MTAGFILAGGLSQRMGADKRELHHMGKSFMDIGLGLLKDTGLQSFVISNDHRPHCGPLGGVETAFLQIPCDSGLFLPCDMPLLTREYLESLLLRYAESRCPVVSRSRNGKAGFPFLLRRSDLPLVTRLLDQGEYPLKKLFQELKPVYVDAGESEVLLNVNTPHDYAVIRQMEKT